MSSSCLSIHQGVLRLQDPNAHTEEVEEAIASLSEETAHAITHVDLTGGVLLQRLPDNLSRLSCVKYMTLNHCHSLTDLSGIEPLVNLTHLTAIRCFKLQTIQAIEDLSLKVIDLSYCNRLSEFSPLHSQTKNLEELGLGGLFVFKQIPAFIVEMNKFDRLNKLDVRDSFVAKNIQPSHLQMIRCKNVLI